MNWFASRFRSSLLLNDVVQCNRCSSLRRLIPQNPCSTMHSLHRLASHVAPVMSGSEEVVGSNPSTSTIYSLYLQWYRKHTRQSENPLSIHEAHRKPQYPTVRTESIFDGGGGVTKTGYGCASQIIIRTGIIEVSRYGQKYDMPWLQDEIHRNSRYSNAQKEQSSPKNCRKSRGQYFLLNYVYTLYLQGIIR